MKAMYFYNTYTNKRLNDCFYFTNLYATILTLVMILN